MNTLIATTLPQAEKKALGEQYYAEYYPRIHRYFISRMSSNREDAEDLAQTVFLKIFSFIKRDLWAGEGDIRYIFTVARNTLIDYYRKIKHTPIVSDELVTIASEATVSYTMDSGSQHSELIRCAMADLNTSEAKAVHLRYFMDMKYSAISKIMDRREDSVRQLVHRGIKALRISLKPHLVQFGY